MSTIEAPRQQEPPKGENYKQRFRRLAKELHPDRGGDPKEFRKAREEYERLKAIEDEAEKANALQPKGKAPQERSYSTPNGVEETFKNLERISGESREAIEMMFDAGYTSDFLEQFYTTIAEVRAEAQSLCNLVNGERIRNSQPQLTRKEEEGYIESEVAKIRKEMLDEFSRNDRAQAA